MAATGAVTLGTISALGSSTVKGMLARPSKVQVNRSMLQSITLIGFGTTWTGGTTFTLSGVAGVTKVSQTVSSGTVARVVIKTGSTTGTLTISDGTYPATVSVAKRPSSRMHWFPGLRKLVGIGRAG